MQPQRWGPAKLRFVCVRRVTADKVISAMAPFGGTVLRTNLSDEQEARLKAALKAV